MVRGFRASFQFPTSAPSPHRLFRKVATTPCEADVEVAHIVVQQSSLYGPQLSDCVVGSRHSNQVIVLLWDVLSCEKEKKVVVGRLQARDN